MNQVHTHVSVFSVHYILRWIALCMAWAIAPGAWAQPKAATESLLQACHLPVHKKELKKLTASIDSKAKALHALGLDGVKADVCTSVRSVNASLHANYARIDKLDRNAALQADWERINYGNAVLGMAILHRMHHVPMTPDVASLIGQVFDLPKAEAAQWGMEEARGKIQAKGLDFIEENYVRSGGMDALAIHADAIKHKPFADYICSTLNDFQKSGCPGQQKRSETE